MIDVQTMLPPVNTDREIVVFRVRRETHCSECSDELYRGSLLRLEDNAVGDAGVRALSAGTHWANLTTLNLRWNHVSDEGAIERMARYHADRALTVCAELADIDRQTCLSAAKNKMYSTTKDLSLYLRP